MTCKQDTVAQAVCFHLNLPLGGLSEKTRKREIVYARHFIHYFLSLNNELTLVQIGMSTGKNHSTVLNSIRIISGYFPIYPNVREIIFTIAFYIKWLNQLDMEITHQEVSTQQIRYLYFLLDQLGIRHLKHELVQDASEGRTESARELKNKEFHELINHLEEKLKSAKQDARPAKQAALRMDRMRKRILSICYSIGWTRFDPDKRRHTVDLDRLRAWLLKYGYLHKEINDYTYLELPALVTQVEKLLVSTLENKSKSARS